MNLINRSISMHLIMILKWGNGLYSLKDIVASPRYLFNLTAAACDDCIRSRQWRAEREPYRLQYWNPDSRHCNLYIESVGFSNPQAIVCRLAPSLPVACSVEGSKIQLPIYKLENPHIKKLKPVQLLYSLINIYRCTFLK